MASDRVNETTAVRRSLKAAGYTAKVGHGRGTAWSWIYVNVTGPWTWDEFSRDHESKAYAIIKHAAGRDNRHNDSQTDYFCENILLEYKKRI